MDISRATATHLHDSDDLGGAVDRTTIHDVTKARYREIELRWDQADGILWCDMAPTGRPSFTYDLMAEFRRVQHDIRRIFTDLPPGTATPFDVFVSGSRTPGIYNLGGDLPFFIERIRARDFESMRRYAHGCVDGQYENSVAYGAPIITMALIRGDALGGGFEFALSYDLIVAERSARLGLPEVLFSLFPGMGAYSFISRRLDRRRAEELILSGRIYTATELHEMGLIDVLAEDGCGEQAVRDYIATHRRRFAMERAIYEARRRVNPVTRAELRSVVDLWAETTMNLTERDLKVMARLAAAQDRRMAGIRQGMRVV